MPKILVSSLPAYGHFYPMVPLINALQNCGCEVTAIVSAQFASTVESCGVRSVSGGSDWLVSNAGAFRRATHPLSLVSAVTARMAEDVGQILEQWSPDVVLSDQYEYGAPIGAEVAGVPVILFGVTDYRTAEADKDALEVRAKFGLPTGIPPPLMYIDPYPPSLQNQQIEAERNVQPIRFETRVAMPVAPLSAFQNSSWPTIFVSLGTVVNRKANMIQRVIGGLMDHELNLLVSVGPAVDPASIDVRRENVQVHAYVAPDQAFRGASLTISHGGFGTTLGSLSHGVPVLSLLFATNLLGHPAAPMRWSELGVGAHLNGPDISDETILSAVQSILGDPGAMIRSRAIAREIRDAPQPAEVAETILTTLGFR